MEDTLFRKKSLERISSPDALDEYLHVTSPSAWLILAAVVLLLSGMLVWSSSARIDSFVTGTALVEDGTMYIRFDSGQAADHVESGMTVMAGETADRISSVGTDERGGRFAVASTTLADGSYPVKIVFRQTQVLSLLFN